MVEWRSARDQTGRIEVLLTHMKNLGAAHCATTLDERLAGMRTKWHLSGTSAIQEVEQRLKGKNFREVCWRDIYDVKQANVASIKNLTKGLMLARQNVVKYREKAFAGLSP